MRKFEIGAASLSVIAFALLLHQAGCGGDYPIGSTEDAGPGSDADPFPPNNDGSVFNKGDGGPCGNIVTCSADLHSVVDGCGNVVEQCPSNQGCSPDGECIAACDAASANKSSVGCDYHAVGAMSFTSLPTCFAAYVNNTWGSPITVKVDRAGQPLSGIGYIPTGSGVGMTYTALVNDAVPAGSVAVFFLSDDNDPGSCPDGVNVGVVGQNVGVAGSRKDAAFHIMTSAPTVAESVFPFGDGKHRQGK